MFRSRSNKRLAWAKGARLRATMTSGGPVLLRTNMGAGHGGASGRFSRLDEVAIAYAFALWAVGPAHEAEI